MSMNVIKPDVGSGLIVQRSYLFQPAPYRPAAVSSAARRNIVINPSIRYLSRQGGTKGGALPLMLLLAACGGGGGGDTPPVITTSRQSASAAPTPPEDTQQKEVSPPEDTPAERAPPQQEEISPSILPLREPPPKEPGREVSGDLYDPPIIGAKVYVDVNRNRRVDGEDHLLDENTDASGGFEGTIPAKYREMPLVTDNRDATHDGDLPSFFVASPESNVISPITHIIELRVVSKEEITGHVLFARFQPFSDNPYDTRETRVFSNRIEEFLPELTALIILYTDENDIADVEKLRPEVLALLDRYVEHLKELDQGQPVNAYGPLTIQSVIDLTVTENTKEMAGTTRLTVQKKSGDSVDKGFVEYRLKGGETHDFIEVTSVGSIRLHRAPDHEVMPVLRIEVEARWVKAGQGVDENWQGARAVEIAVTDIDEDPTALALDIARHNLAETTDTAGRTALARITVTDPDRKQEFLDHKFTLSDEARFEVVELSLIHI